MKFVRWAYNEQIEEQMDTTKKNILIIEAVERMARKLLLDSVEMYSSIHLHKSDVKLMMQREPETLWEKILRYLYNENINQNLEFNLFDYRFLTPVKEFKAELNYRVFGRTNNDVSVSTDGKYLLYGPTTDSTKKTSSFNPVSDKEINDLILSINNAYEYFKKLGFDEVYLSLVPSPVTIVDPYFGNYNNLIVRIQNSRDLKIPIINVFDILKTASYPIYFRSDSHWNYDGFQLWVDQTNKVLRKYK